MDWKLQVTRSFLQFFDMHAEPNSTGVRPVGEQALADALAACAATPSHWCIAWCSCTAFASAEASQCMCGLRGFCYVMCALLPRHTKAAFTVADVVAAADVWFLVQHVCHMSLPAMWQAGTTMASRDCTEQMAKCGRPSERKYRFNSQPVPNPC